MYSAKLDEDFEVIPCTKYCITAVQITKKTVCIIYEYI